MRKTWTLLLIISTIVFFGCCTQSCTSDRTKSTTNVTVNSNVGLAGEDFDLQALGELIKKVKNTEELEKEINKKGGINNLDLDENGEVDFIKVTEYGSGDQIGYSFTAVLKDGEPEIATIEISKTTEQLTVSGSETYYGSGSYYNSHYSRDWLLIGYIYSPLYRPYYSPYRYGYYGGYYSPYRSVPYATYSTRSSVQTARTSTTYKKSATPATKSTVKSPNKTNTSKTATKTASKKSLAKSTATRKDFKKGTSADKNKKATGFGNKKSTNTTKKSTTKKSTTKKSTPTRSRSRSSSRKCDINAKTDIIQYVDALEKLNSVNVYNFRYDDFHIENENLPTGIQIGFIAQEIEVQFPEAIVYDEFTGELSVDERVLIPILFKSIQELSAEVEALKRDK